MTTDLRLVANTAERHARERTAGRMRNRAPDRGLAHTGRTDQAQDRALELLHPLLHGQVFEDPRLYLFQAVVIVFENLLGTLEIMGHA